MDLNFLDSIRFIVIGTRIIGIHIDSYV